MTRIYINLHVILSERSESKDPVTKNPSIVRDSSTEPVLSEDEGLGMTKKILW